eukprot:m.145993 g.145993  ORF g.145993 m.145993 type:complete len:576 (+) comp17755_c0_seq1:151-1878(+)
MEPTGAGGRQLLNYETGMDGSTATWVSAYSVAAVFFLSTIHIMYPSLTRIIRLAMEHRFEMERDVNGDHKLARFELLFGSYFFTLPLFGMTLLVRGLVQQNYAHTEDFDGTPAGYKALQRIFGLLFGLSCSSLTLTGKHPWYVGHLAHHGVVKHGSRLVAAAFIVYALVALIVAFEDGKVFGSALCVASVPSLVVPQLAITHAPTPRRQLEGRFAFSMGALAVLVTGVWLAGWDTVCTKPQARCEHKCPFEDNATHNLWAHLFLLVFNCVIHKGHITIAGQAIEKVVGKVVPMVAFERHDEGDYNPPTVEIHDADENIKPPSPAPATPPPASNPPKATPEPVVMETKTPTPPPTADPVVQPVPTKSTLQDDGTILRKLYDMFTKSDSGDIDIADAGLTADEFTHHISVKALHDTLKPIGGLDLSRLDPSLKHAKGEKIPIQQVFDTLNVNKDDRVTATEFVKLLKSGAARVFKVVIEDQVLRKLYDLFSAADSGVLSVSDANLSTAEFEAYITIAKLEDALKPVGGLSMKRVDDNYNGDDKKVTIEKVFAMLDKDKNDSITASEFIKLVREKVYV